MGYGVIWGHMGYGDTAMGWRAMGSHRVWGHKRYRAITVIGPWGDTAMG